MANKIILSYLKSNSLPPGYPSLIWHVLSERQKKLEIKVRYWLNKTTSLMSASSQKGEQCRIGKFWIRTFILNLYFIVTVCRLLQTLCVSVCLSRFYGLYLALLWVESWSNLVKMLQLWSDWLYQNFNALCRSGFALRMMRVMDQRCKTFSLHFYAFQSMSSRSRHTVFFRKILSAKRKSRSSEASKMRARIYCARLWQSVTLATVIFLFYLCDTFRQNVQHLRVEIMPPFMIRTIISTY